MTTIYDLLKELKDKTEQLNKLRIELVEEKRLRDLDEASLWFSIDFKAIGATSEKIKSAAVKQRLNEFPNTYAQKKSKFENLEADIKLIRKTIDVMREFGVDVIDPNED
ncbi:MAG: hypothetical protein IKT40_01960 [Bacilli bacterium]|nr:hypothetical protein [Bacilli bacterium]